MHPFYIVNTIDILIAHQLFGGQKAEHIQQQTQGTPIRLLDATVAHTRVGGFRHGRIVSVVDVANDPSFATQILCLDGKFGLNGIQEVQLYRELGKEGQLTR